MDNKENIMDYNLGMSLSGGGARGFAHLGVLQAMNEFNLFPEILSGTSAGAFAAALYADGNSPKDILSFFRNKGFKEFIKFTFPTDGLFRSTGLSDFIASHLNANSFSDLKIPLKIVATDVENGCSKVFYEGSLLSAIVASCSIPLVFCPVEIDGKHYVDGGLFKNFPVSVIRDDCKTLVGVNVSPIEVIPYKNTLKYIAERSFHYMLVSNSLHDANLCDFILEPQKLAPYALFDMDRLYEIYQIGYDCGIAFLEDNNENLLLSLS